MSETLILKAKDIKIRACAISSPAPMRKLQLVFQEWHFAVCRPHSQMSVQQKFELSKLRKEY